MAYEEKEIKVPRFEEKNGFYTSSQRSRMMSRIRGKETKPERKLRKLLWGLGIRYRKNVSHLPGKPDIVIRKYRLIIFIDGAFWHGYQWEEKKKKIKANRDFWIPKIERTIQRDAQNNALLHSQGWTVLRFWDHEIKKNLGSCLRKILQHVEACEYRPRLSKAKTK